MFFIYRYTPTKIMNVLTDNKTTSGTYQVTEFFTDEAQISKQMVLEFYDEYMGIKKIGLNSTRHELCFDSLNELGLFAIQFISKMGIQKCNLLSLLEFNSVIDETYTVNDFFDCLHSKGTILNNPKMVTKNSASSFFGKFFDR
ncbi:MAG: hypothetical protein U0T83_00890 [Bacteriovoracaceae bacterium]